MNVCFRWIVYWHWNEMSTTLRCWQVTWTLRADREMQENSGRLNMPCNVLGYISSVHLSAHLSIHHLVISFIHSFIYLFFHPPIHPSTNQSIHATVHPSTQPLIHPSVHPPSHSSIHPLIHPPISSSSRWFLRQSHFAWSLFFQQFECCSWDDISSWHDKHIRRQTQAGVDARSDESISCPLDHICGFVFFGKVYFHILNGWLRID